MGGSPLIRLRASPVVPKLEDFGTIARVRKPAPEPCMDKRAGARSIMLSVTDPRLAWKKGVEWASRQSDSVVAMKAVVFQFLDKHGQDIRAVPILPAVQNTARSIFSSLSQAPRNNLVSMFRRVYTVTGLNFDSGFFSSEPRKETPAPQQFDAPPVFYSAPNNAIELYDLVALDLRDIYSFIQTPAPRLRFNNAKTLPSLEPVTIVPEITSAPLSVPQPAEIVLPSVSPVPVESGLISLPPASVTYENPDAGFKTVQTYHSSDSVCDSAHFVFPVIEAKTLVLSDLTVMAWNPAPPAVLPFATENTTPQPVMPMKTMMPPVQPAPLSSPKPEKQESKPAITKARSMHVLRLPVRPHRPVKLPPQSPVMPVMPARRRQRPSPPKRIAVRQSRPPVSSVAKQRRRPPKPRKAAAVQTPKPKARPSTKTPAIKSPAPKKTQKAKPRVQEKKKAAVPAAKKNPPAQLQKPVAKKSKGWIPGFLQPIIRSRFAKSKPEPAAPLPKIRKKKQKDKAAEHPERPVKKQRPKSGLPSGFALPPAKARHKKKSSKHAFSLLMQDKRPARGWRRR